MADGGAPPPTLNAAWLALLPNGSDPSDDALGVVHESAKLRPLCLKNVDIKVVAGVTGHSIRSTLQKYVIASQRSFVPGRNIMQHVYE